MAEHPQIPIAEIKSQVDNWLQANWSPDLDLKAWREILVEGGWAAPAWPEEYFGRNFSAEQAAAVAEVFDSHGAVGVAQGGPGRLASHTILVHGNKAQKDRYLRPILTGEHAWCQLFSEPGSGSDLAGLTTKAEKQGDRWVVNGQKVWNTSAHHADFGILVARTNWDVPKHQGISILIVDTDSPGISMNPMYCVGSTTAERTNVLFFDKVKVPKRTKVITFVDEEALRLRSKSSKKSSKRRRGSK